jgi:hypothetical protein
MMDKDNVIQKQILYLDVHTQVVSPLALQEATSKWCSEVLVNAIGKRLEKYAGMEDVIRIDKIELELNTGESLDEMLAEKIALEIEREIQARIPAEQKTELFIDKERTLPDAFVFFLQNGYLPWWSSMKTIEDLTLLKQPPGAEERRLLKELLQNKTVAIRFATSLPLRTFIGMLSRIFEVKEKQVDFFFEKIEKLATVIRDKDLQNQFFVLIKQQLVVAFVREANEALVAKYAIDVLLHKYQLSPAELRNHIHGNKLLSKDITLQHALLASAAPNTQTQNEQDISLDIIKQQSSKKLIEQNLPSEKKQSAQKQDGIYIGNAGLVLLAPFIPRFFENLGIVENNIFNSNDLALAMLQWLVTGNELHAEFDLVLPKIICGMEPEEPVIIIPHLPEGFKKEGETLLQSVIEYWSILKNTSVAGLRESFLQRDGKLSFYKDEWLLQVEQKPYDMLLEQLPWNISMIRLSWMQYLLRTEWIG